MGNFNNVSMGNGLLRYNGVDVGFLKGDVSYRYNYDVEDFKTGVPLALQGSITKEIVAELEAPIAELSAENIAMALGGLTPVSTGTTQNVAAGSPSVRTFATFGSGGLEAIVLDGPNVTNLVVKSSDDVTTYVEGTDYFLVPGSGASPGFVYRNPNGNIPSGATVNASYDYQAVTGQQIDLGTQFSLQQGDLEFVHTSPVTGKDITVKMWKATTNGVFDINFAESNFIINNVVFKAIFDSSHPSNPLGYIHREA